MPGQYASWAVTSHAAAVPYRYFRLLLVGPNPEAANRYHMCLSYWELCEYFNMGMTGLGVGVCAYVLQACLPAHLHVTCQGLLACPSACHMPGLACLPICMSHARLVTH